MERRALLGGKGASLSDMTGAGYNVPPGFTITTEACRYVLANNGQWPAGLEQEVSRRVAELEAMTGRCFGDGSLLVSVRSGAARSMPGMMDTLLNVGADIKRDAMQVLREAIDAVFNSWKSARAQTYRRQHGLDNNSGTAVNIQMMFPSEVSGVIFTRNPNAPDDGILLIEAAHGLGEAVVSGDVTPDNYRVRRDAINDYEVIPGGNAAERGGVTVAKDDPSLVLSRAQVQELAEMALRLEQWAGAALDIEWGIASGELALLQYRAIRGMDVLLDVEKGRQSEIERLRKLCEQSGAARKLWVMHNLGETLTAPTPLTWSIIREFMLGDGGFGRMYRDFGYRPHADVAQDGFLELICGRIYADPDRQAGLFWGSMPLVYDLDAVIADPAVLEGPPGKLDPDRATPEFLIELPRTLTAMLRCWKSMQRAAAGAAACFEQKVLPGWLEYVQESRKTVLGIMSESELLEELNARIERVMHSFGKESLKPGFYGGLALARVQKLLGQFTDDSEAAQWASRLTTGLEGDLTAEQDRMLSEVAVGSETMESFLERFGHRATGEMELARPRWHEDPAALDPLLEQARRNGIQVLRERHSAAVERGKAALSELPAQLKEWGGSTAYEEIAAAVAQARELLPYRENGKYYLMMGYDLIRQALLVLAQKWNIGPDLFYLELGELAEYPLRKEYFDEQIKQRRVRWQSFQRLEMPQVLDSRQLDKLGTPDEVEGGEERSGTALASGTASGPAVVISDPSEAIDLPDGYILVCPSTDPGWASLFTGARGLVVERGGTLSHGAIVARDFGIPAVACPRVTHWLSSGDTIRIDGNKGRVVRIGGSRG